MIARDLRPRTGITLVEILISILIMGIGMISLATLFPLGLLRLREAIRSSRGGLAVEVAANDIDVRALFYKPSFMQTWYWTPVGTAKVPRDPFVQDALNGAVAGVIASGSKLFPANNVGLGSGLPFCYDPLWRSITGVVPNIGLSDPTLDFKPAYANAAADARFGAGVFSNGSYPYLRDDPNPNGGNKVPSGYGLQRLTNFVPWSSAGLTPQYPFTSLNASLTPAQQPSDVSGTIFSSNDDVVFNASSGNLTSPSPLIPDMSAGGPQADYRFTWFVTGRQLDANGNGMQFVGEVVVTDGRPFGFDPLPNNPAISAPAGETVVEAVYGYGSTVFSAPSRTVLIRWPSTLPDPQVRAGGWICDTTYEASTATYAARSRNVATTFARCSWYQVGKRTEPQADALIAGSGYRSMVLTLTSPVRDKTALDASGLPFHLNVALVMPSVINVYPRSFEVH